MRVVGTIDTSRIGLKTYCSYESITKYKSIPVSRGQAFAVLSNADQRAAYDRHGKEGARVAERRGGAPGFAGGFGPGQAHTPTGAETFCRDAQLVFLKCVRTRRAFLREANAKGKTLSSKGPRRR